MNVPPAGSIPTNSPFDGEWRAMGEGKIDQGTKRERPASRDDKAKRQKLVPQQSKPSSRQPSASKSNKCVMKMNTSSSSPEEDRLVHEEHNDDNSEKQKRFRIFVVVLLECLHQWNPRLHQEAKTMVDDASTRVLYSWPEHPSQVHSSLKDQLQALVGQKYWSRADVALGHFLEAQKQQALRQGLPFHLSSILDDMGVATQEHSRSDRLSNNSRKQKKPAPPPTKQVKSSKPKAKTIIEKRRINAGKQKDSPTIEPEATFARHFKSLQKIMKTHYPDGGYVLASECKCGKTLQGWIGHIRYNYRLKAQGKSHIILTDERIEQLNAIGFLWENPAKSRDKSRSKLKPTQAVPRAETVPKSTSKSPTIPPSSNNDSESKETPDTKRKLGRPKKRDFSKQEPSTKKRPEAKLVEPDLVKPKQQVDELFEKQVTDTTHDDPFEFDADFIDNNRNKESTKCDVEGSIESPEAEDGGNQAKEARFGLTSPKQHTVYKESNGEISSETEELNNGGFVFDSLSKEDLLRLYLDQRDLADYLRTDRDALKSKLERSKTEIGELQRMVKEMEDCNLKAKRGCRVLRQTAGPTPQTDEKREYWI